MTVMMSERCWCTSYTVRTTLWHLAGSLIGATHLPVPGPAPPRTSATLCGPRSIYMHPSIPFHCWEEVGGCWERRELLLVERMLLLLPSQKYCRCRVVGDGWTDFNYSPGRLHLHCIALQGCCVSSSSSLLSLFTLINALDDFVWTNIGHFF